MKIITTNNGSGPSSCAEYDWSRLKYSFITYEPCRLQDNWMIICSVGNGPGMRFYRASEAQAQVLAARWITCQHDRTPQPKFNAQGQQVGWWKPTYEAEAYRSLLARADELARAIDAAEDSLHCRSVGHYPDEN